MANKNKQRRKKVGGKKSNVSSKKVHKRNKLAEVKTQSNFTVRRVVIGVTVVVIISAAVIAYYALQNKSIDLPRNKSIKAESSIKKPNLKSNRKLEQNTPVNKAGENTSITGPDIKFEKMVHDYGTIQKGSDGSCEFVFKNTGKEPLVLSNVKSSCGCTVPTWPKEPILAGNSGVIKVVYDTKRVGAINKSIFVNSNANEGVIQLKIKGQVVEN